jgi:hypothetical protein
VISFPAHGKIDMGLAATCSAMPSFMAFEDEPEARFFRLLGMNITVVTALTDFEPVQPAHARSRRTA